MLFEAHASLTYLFNGACETLALVEPARTAEQDVRWENLALLPAVEIQRRDDARTGERAFIFTGVGQVRLDYRAHVDVDRRPDDLAGAAPSAIRDLPREALCDLRPSRYCPSDRFERFVGREFGGLPAGDKAAAILAWIRDHVDYRADVSDAGTTALDTFADRAGVCRDFTHLAISLFRAADIPARAVSAYAWELDPPDLHAVVEVYLGDRWRLVDPTGKATADRLIRVATGRDAADIAFLSIFGEAELVEQSFAVRRLAPMRGDAAFARAAAGDV